VRRLNRFVEERAPWQLAKDEEKSDELDATLYALTEGLRVTSILLHPFIPKSTSKLLSAIGREGDAATVESAEFGAHAGGQTIGELPQLFPKLEVAQS
jgi:methionyl-tRNA synthetase